MVPKCRASSSAAVAPDVPDPQPESSRDSGCAFEAVDRVDELLRRSSPRSDRAPSSCSARRSYRSEAIANEPGLDELLDARIREPANVHRAPRREMDEPFELAAGTRARSGSSTPPPLRPGPTGVPHDGQRAACVHGRSACRLRFSGTGPMTCGITSPARFTCTMSPTRRSFFADQVLVMQRGELDGRAADLHRLEHRVRIERRRCVHVHFEFLEQRRLRDVGRELARDRPARLASADYTELVLQRERVDLHHAAVDGEVERAAQMFVLQPCAHCVHVVQRRALPVVRRHGNAPRRERRRALRSAS